MRNVFWGVVLVTIGFLFLLDNLGIADFGSMVHDFWPLILIVWGISVLMRRREQEPREASVHVTVEDTPPAGNEIRQDMIHQSTVAGNFYSSIISGDFMGGSVSVVFGDCDLDLSKTVFAEGEHVLRLHGVFGNTTLILPRDCAASIQTSTVLGNVSALGQRRDGFTPSLQVMTPDYINAGRRLKITANRVFGDIRVV